METNEEQIEENNENNQENEPTSNLSQMNFSKPTIYYYNTSKDNYHAKHFNKALVNIIIYIKLVPNNPKAYILKGKIYLNLNQFEKSLLSFLRSEKLGENKNQNYISLWYYAIKTVIKLQKYTGGRISDLPVIDTGTALMLLRTPCQNNFYLGSSYK